MNSKTGNSLNITIRIAASNQIRNIEEQLKQLGQYENNPEHLMYFGNNTELASQGLPQKLDRMTRLALLQAKYTDQMIPFEDSLSNVDC